MRPLRRREAWLRIFVVRCSLPCDPPVGGHSCNGEMIPRFHRAVSGRDGRYGPPPALDVLLGLAERAYDLRLPMPCNVTVARKCREDILVAEVLGPSLVLLGRLADLAAEKRQGFPEAMRVEVGQAG